jgi:hypothetical protein
MKEPEKFESEIPHSLGNGYAPLSSDESRRLGVLKTTPEYKRYVQGRSHELFTLKRLDFRGF